MAEEYAAKMSRKTLAELRDYVDNRYQYREEAVLAALDELARRGQPEPAAATITAELHQSQQATEQREAAARQQVEEEATARRVARGEEPVTVSEASAPALYSPGSIALFSLLPMSMMIGGGVLLALNLLRLRRIRALLGLVLFMAAYLVVGSQLLTWAMVQHGLDPFVGLMLFNVPAMVVYLRWFWPRYVSTDQYRSRSLLPPIVICFLLVWGLQKAMPYFMQHQPKEVQLEMQQLLQR